MNSPFFSIVVLVYKVAPFLRQCLDSIIAQTFTDFEAILVDDGSPDDCPSICDEYRAQDPRFVVIHQNNGGIANARRAAAAAARGLYIGAVDGDDWVEPDYLAQAHEKLQETGADILQFDTYFNTPKEIRVGTFSMAEGFYDAGRFDQTIIQPYRKRDMAAHGIISSSLCIKFIRAALLIPEILELEDDFIFGEDAACVFLCLAKAKSFFYLKKNLYHYRRRPESSTHHYDPEGIEKTMRLRLHVRRRLRLSGKDDLLSLAEVVFLRLLFLHIFMIYAYSGQAAHKHCEIRRIINLETARTAIRTVSIFSTKCRLSLIILAIKCHVPPAYCLVKPKLPKDGLFEIKRSRKF